MPSRHVWARSKIPKPSVMRLEFRSKKGRGTFEFAFPYENPAVRKACKGFSFFMGAACRGLRFYGGIGYDRVDAHLLKLR